MVVRSEEGGTGEMSSEKEAGVPVQGLWQGVLYVD